jgi:opacity protein-like surface antigen
MYRVRSHPDEPRMSDMGVLSRWIGIATLATATALMAASPVVAADMPMAPPPEPYDDGPVTFGTGWYLRGDIAMSKDTSLSIGNLTLPKNQSFPNAWSFGFGAGYKFNEWFRTDLTFDWRMPGSFRGNTIAGMPCQVGAAPVLNVGGAIVGSTPIYAACSDWTTASTSQFHVLYNAYLDLGTWSGVTPYIGAGLGFNSVSYKISQSWYMNNAVAYNPVWTDPFNLGTWNQYWDQTRQAQKFQFAWALMAGVSYAVTPNVAIDVGGRYLNLGSLPTLTNYGGVTLTSTRANIAKEMRIGFRYTPD